MATMAEGVLSNFAGNVLTLLSTEALKPLGMLIGVEDDLNKLKSNVSAIQAVLTDAEERPDKSNSLKDWLQKLGDALYDADDVLDEISTEALRRQLMTSGKHAKEVRIFFSTSNQLAFNYRMSRQIKKIRARLDVISEEKNKFGLIEKSEPKIQYDGLTHRMGTHSAFIEEGVFGREDDMVQIKSLLLDETDHHNVSFIAIVGMGGIGKTTLAKLLYNDTQLSNHFDLKMWVWVSDQFDVKSVVEKMIESTSGSKPNVQEIEALRVKLQELIEGKKYLLIMDDLWDESEQKWAQLKPLLMGGARGSKILITKRDSIVFAEIGSMAKFELKGLSDDSSWSLFQKVAFKEDRPNMNQLGKEILEECKGVPLVIRHIGCLLYTKFSEEEWISFQKDELSRVTQESNDITNILALSYKHLPSHLKQCFAYSSLYPKNYKIEKDLLLKQWVAHGFVQSREGSKSMEDIANDYFMELCWRFFYEHRDNDFVHMHDMMRDLATMVAGAGYVFKNLKDIGERTHHFSLCDEKSWDDETSWNDVPPELLIPSELVKAKGLRTLHMPLYYSKNAVVVDKLVSKFLFMRVLILKYGQFNRVPDFLKKLKHLRYLDLSYNSYLQSVSNFIGELINLQTLNLNGCRALRELPRDINKLVNLRHLYLNGTNLTHMPKGIGKLSCLQTLNLFVLDENKQGSKLSELNEITNLKGMLYIKGLEQLRGNPFEARLANLKDRNGLRELHMYWEHMSNMEESEDELKDETILEGLQLHPNVDFVAISLYKGEGLPNWVNNPASKLTRIELINCNRLQRLQQFHQLPALKVLFLAELRSLKFIDKNNPGSSTSMFFPSLEVLHLNGLPNLEGWWEGESRVEVGNEEIGKLRKNLLPKFARRIRFVIHRCHKLGWRTTERSLQELANFPRLRSVDEENFDHEQLYKPACNLSSR